MSADHIGSAVGVDFVFWNVPIIASLHPFCKVICRRFSEKIVCREGNIHPFTSLYIAHCTLFRCIFGEGVPAEGAQR